MILGFWHRWRARAAALDATVDALIAEHGEDARSVAYRHCRDVGLPEAERAHWRAMRRRIERLADMPARVDTGTRFTER